MIGGLPNTGVPAESIFGGVKGAAVRQMSGGTSRRRVRQARAATQWGRKARREGGGGYNTSMLREREASLAGVLHALREEMAAAFPCHGNVKSEEDFSYFITIYSVETK